MTHHYNFGKPCNQTTLSGKYLTINAACNASRKKLISSISRGENRGHYSLAPPTLFTITPIDETADSGHQRYLCSRGTKPRCGAYVHAATHTNNEISLPQDNTVMHAWPNSATCPRGSPGESYTSRTTVIVANCTFLVCHYEILR